MRHHALFILAILFIIGCGRAEFTSVDGKSQSSDVNANGDPLSGDPIDPNKPPGPPISCVDQNPNMLDAHRCGNASGKKSFICHVPEGNPANRHTLCLPPPAIAAHLREHDSSAAPDDEDHLGPCRYTLPPQQPPPDRDPCVPQPAPAPNPGGVMPE